MEPLLGIPVGLALSTAAGLRIFGPLLATGVAARSGHITRTPGMTWIGVGYGARGLRDGPRRRGRRLLRPWLDNALDTIATPIATGAGIIAMAAVTPDLPPLLRWTLAIVAGGGAAGLAQVSATLLRLQSSALTAGAGNPVVATSELAGSVILSLLGPLAPLLAAAAVLVLLAVLVRRVSRHRRRHRITPA